jgi:virulence-associated protein VapD
MVAIAFDLIFSASVQDIRARKIEHWSDLTSLVKG